MTTIDEYTLHTKPCAATIERLGFLGDELNISIECDGLRTETLEQIGLDVVKSIHVREQVDESRIDVYRGQPQALVRKETYTTKDTKPM